MTSMQVAKQQDGKYAAKEQSYRTILNVDTKHFVIRGHHIICHTACFLVCG